MKVLITGITGNLGYEVALDLNKRGFTIIPIVREAKNEKLNIHKILFKEIIENDLTSGGELNLPDSIDCIVHCAGNIHFSTAGDSNEKMTAKLITCAKKLNIPLYLVSTAYIYRPPSANQILNNAYELDKFRSEQILISSGIEYAIFRPSVLVGNSHSGKIQNFSGYYSIVRAFLYALTSSKRKGKKLRFPNLAGKSNLVPVDQAAFYIGNAVENLNLKSLYITNPNPPEASWILKETLDFFDLSQDIELIEITFEQFGKLNLTIEERGLYKFVKHYFPYWSITYDFPSSICRENIINHDYIVKTLTFLNSSNFLKIGEKYH